MAKGKFQTKYPWADIGSEIIQAYTAGASPLTLSARYKIPKGAIASYLGRNGVRRNKKDAKRVEREQQRKRRHAVRICTLCTDEYTPKSPNQQYCLGCIPNDTARGRFTSKGITQKTWDQLYFLQNGKCALCEREPTDVDHDHVSLIVRGLLCGGCNQALNRLERIGWAERATVYLKCDTGHRVSAAQQARIAHSAQQLAVVRKLRNKRL